MRTLSSSRAAVSYSGSDAANPGGTSAGRAVLRIDHARMTCRATPRRRASSSA